MTITRRQFTAGTLGSLAAAAWPLAAFGKPEGAMRRNAIPSSGEEIPVIGLGTNRYGVGPDAAARTPLREALSRFHELGGTVIDTAPMYRSSESVLGDLIAELGIRDETFMATKVDVEGTEAQFERMARSFARLKYQKIDLMQCHNLIGWQRAIPAMRELKEQGKVRYIGITSSRNRQYEEMEEIMRAHELDFIQINYSLADQRESADRLIPLAADRGMAVMVNRPFGGGRVFSKLGEAAFPEWAREFGANSWGQFLLKYVLGHPAVTVIIPGMTKARHVEDNMQAAFGRLPTASERQRMEAFFDAL